MTTLPPNALLHDLVIEERDSIGTFDGDNLPVYGVTNTEGVITTGVPASEDRSKYLRLRPGRLVYNPYRINVGSIGLASHAGDGICSPAYTVIKPKPSLLPEYLLYFLKSARGNQLINFCGNRGSVRSALRFADLGKITIPLMPLDDQRRVLLRITELASKIDEAKHIRLLAEKNLSALYSKLLISAFQPLLSYSVPLGEVFRITTGGTPSRSNPAFWEGDVKWVSSGEVAFCSIADTREKITRFGVDGSNAKIYPPNTVLVAMIGQGKTRGQCAILDCHAATNQNVAAIHVYATAHIPRYVYWWFFANYQTSRATETGTAQPALSAERIKRMTIPLPSSKQQTQIVDQLDALQVRFDALRKLQAETSLELDAVFPAILDKAFRGDL